MLKECIEKILSLAPAGRFQIHGREYADRPLVLVAPPRSHEPLELMTLTGLVGAVRSRLDDLDPALWLIEVVSHEHVRIVSRHTSHYGQREVLLDARLNDGERFPFGRFIPREEFIIGLHSQFAQEGDALEVLRLASALGVSAKGRVKLEPYRTFREVEQPVSDFVFRLRSRDGMVPECALFEADGGHWKLDAVVIIKEWLESQDLGMPVVA